MSIRHSIIATAICLTFAAVAVHGQTNTWNGSIDALWNNPSNWGGGVPVDGQVVLFSPTAPNTTLDLGGGTSAILDRVQWAGASQPGFTLSNGSLRILDGGLIRITNTVPAVTQTVQMDTQFQGSGFLTNASTAATLNVGNVAFDPGGTLTLFAEGTINVSGSLAGGSLVKDSPAQVSLTGTNTYAGTTTINEGYLRITSIADGGIPCALGSASSDPGNIVLNGGTILYAGSGPGASDRLFTLTPAGGTIDLHHHLDLINDGQIAYTEPGLPRTLRLIGAAVGTLGARITDAGGAPVSLEVDGADRWNLTGSNDYSGTTHIASGELRIARTSAASPNSLYDVGSFGVLQLDPANDEDLTIGGLTGNGTVLGSLLDGLNDSNLRIGANSLDSTFSGNFSEHIPDFADFFITKIGSGRLTLAGVVGTNDGVTINEGILQLGDGGTGAAFNAPTLANHAAFVVNQSGYTNFSAVISGAGSLTQGGTGTVALWGDNDYTGPTILQGGGMLRADDGVGLPASSPLVIFNGMFESHGSFTRSIGSGPGQIQLLGNGAGFSAVEAGLDVNFGGAGATVALHPDHQVFWLNHPTSTSPIEIANGLSMGPVARTLQVGANVVTLSGPLTGSASLTKTGPGKLVLTNAANSYSGLTTVNSGTLLVEGEIQNSGVLVTDGRLGGSGTIHHPITIETDGTVAPGSSVGILNCTDGATINGGTIEIEINGAGAGTGHDQLHISGGNINLGSGVTALSLPNAAGSFNDSDALFIVSNSGPGATFGHFDGLIDGGSGGTEVPALAGLGGYASWRIHYSANEATGELTGGNDIALVPNCIPFTITEQPVSTISCITGAATFNVHTTNDAGVSFQWEAEVVGFSPWTPLTDGHHPQIGDVSGSNTYELTVTNPIPFEVNLRCRLSATCSELTTEVVQISILSSGSGDANIDGNFDGRDIQPLVNFLINDGPVSEGYCYSDVDFDGIVTTADITMIVDAMLHGW